MADGIIQVPPDSTGKKLDTEEVVVGANTVQQQRVRIVGTATITGALTDTQLRASAVPVSGPLTDTQLRATAVPVSGTVTASGPLTDTQLRATAVPVSAGALTRTTVQTVVTTVDPTTLLAAPTTGKRWILDSITMYNRGATVGVMYFELAEAASEILRYPGLATETARQLLFPGGFALPVNSLLWLETGDSTDDLYVTCAAHEE